MSVSKFHFRNNWPKKELFNLASRIVTLVDTRGQSFTLNYIKSVRIAYLNFLGGKPIKLPGVKLTRDGIPCILGALIPHLRGSKPPAGMLRALNSILWATRALNLGREPDINPIVGASRMSISNFGKYAKDFWVELGYKPSLKSYPKALTFKKFHMTTKTGPNGHALWTSLRDFISLPDSLKNSLLFLGGPKFAEKVSVLERAIKHVPSAYLGGLKDMPGPGEIRRLSYFPDKENKVRVIAIGDYFSQTVLRPVHDYLFRVLKKIPQDATFFQGGFVDRVKFDGRVHHCVDLTAATDRFPIEAICQVLQGLLPHEWVQHWRNIMVGYPFLYKDKNGHQSYISYGAGNPMGFYSSWASFTVAHHYLVYYCCREVGINWKDCDYNLLGDDIIISNSEVAAKYKEMLVALGVEYSPSKTITSPHLIEFAKRLIYKGEEVTPFPISAMKEATKSYYVLVALLLDYMRRGWELLPNISIPVSVGSWHEIFLSRPSRWVKKVREKSDFASVVMSITRGALPAGEGLTSLARQYGYPELVFSDEIANNILRNIAVQLFAESNPENETKPKKGSVGLGPTAISMVEFLSGFMPDEDPMVGIDLIYAHPILYAYGLIEEMFIDLKKEALRIDRNGLDWSPLLKTMALPLDDRIFVRRSSHVIYKATAVMGNKLKESFETLRMYPQLLA